MEKFMTTAEQKRIKSAYMKEWRNKNLDKALATEKKTREKPERKSYMRKYLREYRKKFPEKHQAIVERGRNKMIERKRREKRDDKELVYSHYGKMCICCGETEILFLTIDHINNDGSSDRRINGSHIYRRIIRDGFPKTFQVLCRNCNWGKHMNGGICPHKITSKH